MTENLAGRGEGLAGLVAKWRERANKCPWCRLNWDLGAHGCHFEPVPPGEQADEYGGVSENCKAFTLRTCIRELETALEAAAPPSTPSQAETDCRAILSLMGKEPYLAKGHVEDGEYQWTVVADKVSVTEMLREAALATPSPQAPGESYPGQDYVHAHNKNIRNADNAAAVRRAFQLIADANTVTILSLSEMQTVVLNELRLVPGSPRKVGEDGPLKYGDVVWVPATVIRVFDQQLNVGIHRLGPNQHSYYAVLDKNEIVRSSSVPVGEQK